LIQVQTFKGVRCAGMSKKDELQLFSPYPGRIRNRQNK